MSMILDTANHDVAATLCPCLDSQLRRKSHESGQRYTSPSSGKCKPLTVQVAKLQSNSRTVTVHGYKEARINSRAHLLTRLSVRLTMNLPKSPQASVSWISNWVLYCVVLLLPRKKQSFTDSYKPFLMRYVGQLFAARSPREHSILSSPTDRQGEAYTITHATNPRRLVYFDHTSGRSGGWVVTEDPDIVMHQPYIAITFCRRDFIHGKEDSAEQANSRQAFIRNVRTVVRAEKFNAYWLDLECIDEAERGRDLYRMADVYRRAGRTLVMISHEGGWKTWGMRCWTLPEALLSRDLVCKVGDGAVFPLALDVVAMKAYTQYAKEFSMIQAYGAGKDPFERLERNMMLIAAIWRRHSSASEQQADDVTRYHAEKVYALMGFFKHRIEPTDRETELQALARLFMANDNDRIIERMISMLPTDQLSLTCWFTETDYFGAKLWDIEPVVQAVGSTATGAIVLDGCHAASIRWKDFPGMAYATSRSYRRNIARVLPYFFPFIILIGTIIVASTAPAQQTTGASGVPGGTTSTAGTTNPSATSAFGTGVALIVLGVISMLFAPFLTAFGSSGRIVLVRPWLIGVRGVLSAEEVSEHLYGGNIGGFRRSLYTPSGTPFSAPKVFSEFREGLEDQVEAARGAGEYDPQRGHLFTLVDTLSATVYYFRAKKPPTVCLFTGKEGGLGRFVLCSQVCATSELQKEAVLRMPSYIGESMHACDWVAIGGEQQGGTDHVPIVFDDKTSPTQQGFEDHRIY